MDSLTFWAEVLKACAWPAVALLLGGPTLWVVRGLVKDLKLTSVKQGAWELGFATLASDVRKGLPGVGKRPPRISVGGMTTNKFPRSFGGDDPKESPVQMVLEAWSQVEGNLRALATREGVDPNEPFESALNTLVEKGAITAGDASSITGLRQLRNLAVHSPTGELPAQRAQEFVVMAEAIRWVLSGKPQSDQVG